MAYGDPQVELLRHFEQLRQLARRHVDDAFASRPILSWPDCFEWPAWLRAGCDLSYHRLSRRHPFAPPLSAENEARLMIEWASRPPREKMSIELALLCHTLITIDPSLST